METGIEQRQEDQGTTEVAALPINATAAVKAAKDILPDGTEGEHKSLAKRILMLALEVKSAVRGAVVDPAV